MHLALEAGRDPQEVSSHQLEPFGLQALHHQTAQVDLCADALGDLLHGADFVLNIAAADDNDVRPVCVRISLNEATDISEGLV